MSDLLEEPDNGLPLTPNQLRELNRVGTMIARAEPLDTIENAWRHFVDSLLEEYSPSDGKPWDIDNIIYWLLVGASGARARDGRMDDDIMLIMKEIEAMTRAKERLRELIADLNTWISEQMSRRREDTAEIENLKVMKAEIDTFDQKLSLVEDDTQSNADVLQNILQKQQRMLEVMLKTSKMLRDTAMDAIRKKVNTQSS